MKNLHLLLLGITISVLSSCSTKSNEELIVGTWNEVNTGKTELNYHADHTYEINYDDGVNEKGTWRIEDEILYTIAEGDSIELEETLGTLTEDSLMCIVADMFYTKYTRKK